MEETESNDVVNSEVKQKKEPERCIKCLEFQDKLTKANDKCEHLELDLGKRNSAIECLEDEVRLLKQRNQELEKSIGNGVDDDGDKITQLMIENKVLECEKNKAESEIVVWKAKCNELEIKVLELEKRLSTEMVKMGSDVTLQSNDAIGPSGTPPMNTPHKSYTDAKGINGGQKCESKPSVRKFLNFASGGSSDKNILSPSTPGNRPPCGPIIISDSDDDVNDAPIRKRRKVIRGSESDNDDDIPIHRLRDNKRSRRKRLVRLGDLEDKRKRCNKSTETMNNTVIEDEMEDVDDDSSSEGESLGGFIVNSSESDDVSEKHGTMSADGSDDSEHASESSMEYGEVISSLRRDRKDKKKWEYEADMLADFGKCPELCMRAVCALYRQQTAEEKSSKATIVLNGRGFNHIHAYSGSALAEFLTDGDPHSDIMKSVEELQEFDSKGVEQCRKLATHYSKQLFEIHKNEEDSFFHP